MILLAARRRSWRCSPSSSSRCSGSRSLVFRIVSADAYRAHAREDRARSPPTCRRRCRASASCARSRRSRATRREFAELNEDNRDANMTTVYLNAAYFPGVELLSALATVGDPALRRHPGDRRATITIGVLVAFVAALNSFFDPIQQLSQLYTTYQSGMAALDKIFELLDEEPDLVDAPGRDRAAARCAARSSFDDVSFAYGERRRTRSRRRPARPARARRSRSSARPAPASRRSPSSSRASTTRPTGACWSTGTTCATSPQRSLRAQLGIVPAGGLPVQRARSARTSPSAARTRRREEVARPPRAVGADEFIARARRTATTRRSASAACSSRPASASSSRFARALVADPRILDPRRGDLERRRPHRGPHRGRPAAPARRPHRDRHRPPPLDHPRTPAASSSSSTAASSSRAPTTSCSPRAAPTGACTATGPSRRADGARIPEPCWPTSTTPARPSTTGRRARRACRGSRCGTAARRARWRCAAVRG